MITSQVERELTVRAVVTGALLGGVLSLCNIYSGLRIGWGFNMSITAALLGWGIWSALTVGGTHLGEIAQLKVPGTFALTDSRRASLHNLTISFDVSPMMVAVGALGSLRTGVTVLLGGLFSWGVLGPLAIRAGWCEMGPDDPEAAWFTAMVRWLLWPGVAMMVSSSLTSVAFSWRSFVRAFQRRPEGEAPAPEAAAGPSVPPEKEVPQPVLFGLTAVLVVASSIGQWVLFDIPLWMGVFSTLLTFALAMVAGRVSGETTITPVGAMGKVTQLIFGLVRPGDATANLMTANVTGGAASQTGDMLHELKAGLLLGASPRAQAIAQAAGVLGGALCGSAAYLILIPDPQHMLLTDEWPAPAVATWRAVAELFARGIEAMPAGAMAAMAISGALGVVLAILEKVLPEKQREWVPSPASLGLAMTIQVWTCLNLFLGSLAGWALRRWAPDFAKRYLTPIASGVVAGESLMGVGIAIWAIATGGGGH